MPRTQTEFDMSRLSRALRLATNALQATVNYPRQTVESLRLHPKMVQGSKFSGESSFPIPSQSEGSEAEGENPLLSYFNENKEGPGIWKWRHYFEIYERYFRKFVGRPVNVMEVGIFSGGSLPMWRKYFGADCRVYGVDIEPACEAYRGEGTEVFIGDQADRSFWAKVRNAVPKVDILIDDGGHEAEQQRVTLEEMLPHLSPGGVYLCEDILGSGNPFAGYLHGLARDLNFAERSEVPNGVAGMASAPSNFQKAIHSIHFHPFVAVIEKHERAVRQFVAPRHGTQWQPFL